MDVPAVCLGGPSACELYEMFWDMAVGGRVRCSSSKGVSGVVQGGDTGQKENMAEVLMEPEKSNHLFGFGDEVFFKTARSLKAS